MKVILIEDFKNLGKKGDMVTVSDGYARNYLLPREIAIEANAQAISEMKSRDNAEKNRIEKETEEAKEAASKINDETIKISAKAGQNGKLFGSITSKEVTELIIKKYGVDIDKRKVTVEDIKNYGTYEAEIKLYPGIVARVYVLVSE